MASDWIATARLLRRAGFGARGTDVDAAIRLGPTRYVAGMLSADPSADPGAKATPLPSFSAVSPLGKAASKTERAAHNQTLRTQLTAMTGWWIRRMVAVEQPFGEKLTFCWHNHFATSAQKVRDAEAMLTQNARLRGLGRGNFRTLALTMLTDAAMLRWLDGNKNIAGAPNENLAREFMEMFTLGHGDAYTEQDVQQGARALTGWRIEPDGSTQLRPCLHDNGLKTVLRVIGDLGATGFCDAVLAQPGSARYVAGRWWGQLVSANPPSSAVLDRLVTAYGPERDLSALFTAMFTAPEFTAAQGSLVVSPVEWVIGAVRALRVPIKSDSDAARLAVVLRVLGQLPFYPPNVGGWPSGQAWLSTAAADARMRAGAALAKIADLSALDGATPSRLDSVAHLLGVGGWSARSAGALKAAAGNPQRLVTVALNTPEYLIN